MGLLLKKGFAFAFEISITTCQQSKSYFVSNVRIVVKGIDFKLNIS